MKDGKSNVKSNVRIGKNVKNIKCILVELIPTTFYVNTKDAKIVGVLCSRGSGNYVKYEVAGTTKESTMHERMTVQEFMEYTMKNGLGIAILSSGV
jgi:hypothetical protein